MNKQNFNQGVINSSASEDKSPFEILLTPDQFKLLQKILPVGYSLTVADKYTRAKHKRGTPLCLNSGGNVFIIVFYILSLVEYYSINLMFIVGNWVKRVLRMDCQTIIESLIERKPVIFIQIKYKYKSISKKTTSFSRSLQLIWRKGQFQKQMLQNPRKT